MARPTKPHHQSWDNKPVPGLYKCPDGRWRVNATGQKFTEPDERRAIAKFRAIEEKLAAPKLSYIPAGTSDAAGLADTMATVMKNTPTEILITPETRTTPSGAFEVTYNFEQLIAEDRIWALVRRELLERPAWVAMKVGIPELANYAQMDLPRDSLKLQDIEEVYRTKSDVKPESIRESCKTFDTFLKLTGARTLDDLTTPCLTAYRDAIRAKVKSPGTVAAYFGRIKWIIAFAKTEGLDAKQIDAALSRLAILKAPRDTRVHKPSPIRPADFAKLYRKAGELYPMWQPRLLVMLNCCLHFDEALDLEWSDFDLKAGTFCTHRNKRGRVIRAATLWPKTIAALKKIPRTQGTYVFTSAHGTRFDARGQWKTWDALRNAAGCKTVQMDDLRDGSYSAACNASGVDEKLARLLAGHRSHGLQDNYVARNPAIVKPACEAVAKAYGIASLK